MFTNRYFHLSRAAELLITIFVAGPVLYIAFAMWYSMGFKEVVFKDKQDMQEHLEMDLRGTTNHVGYSVSIKGREPLYYWAMFSLNSADLEIFVKNNGLAGKLICDEESKNLANFFMAKDAKGNNRMRKWTPAEFVPTYGLIENGSTILVGTYKNNLYIYVDKAVIKNRDSSGPGL